MYTATLRPFAVSSRLLLVVMLLLAQSVALVQFPLALPSRAPAAPAAALPAVDFDPASLPMPIVANVGQADETVRFQLQTREGPVAFTDAGVLLPTAGGSNLGVVFAGANPAPKLVGADQQQGVVNYFIGNDPARWRTNVATYGAVVYQQLYDGIDVRYEQRNGGLKSTYFLAPNSDPTRIRWRYTGAGGVSLDAAGNLLISTGTDPQSNIQHPTSNITESAPIAWQTIGGQQVPVAVRYELHPDSSIGFALGAYDASQPLVIDPTLGWATFVGGNGEDEGFGVAVDSDGNVYVTGFTLSSDFTPDSGPLSASDAFVAKLNADGSLVYKTIFGGNNNDSGQAIAVDWRGTIYIVGGTASEDFPQRNQIQNFYGGNGDAFVTTLDPIGRVVHSTYLGGNELDLAWDVAVDNNGTISIAGETRSTNLRTTSNAVQPQYSGAGSCQTNGTNTPCPDAFIAKIRPGQAGNRYPYATYLGGGDYDIASSIAIDSAGATYIAGETHSDNFPTANALQGIYGGGTDCSTSTGGNGRCPDGFVTKLTPNGAFDYSTYVGSTGYELASGIAVDGAGSAYVTGYGSGTTFPLSVTPKRAAPGGGDAFVAKFRPDGRSLDYATFLGGTGQDFGIAITVDDVYNAYITGRTSSNDLNAPIVNAPQASFGGGDYDGYFAKLNATGDAITASSYLGGSAVAPDGSYSEDGRAIAVDRSGNAYIVGLTLSPDFPVANAFDDVLNGDGSANGIRDAFVAKIVASPDWYVAQDGADANDCRSVDTPCRTIAAAIGKAGHGDTISVASGTYVEHVSISKNLALVGAGAGSTTIDGNQAGTVVAIEDSIAASITGLTISNGLASPGGGLFVQTGALLRLADSAITNNRSTTFAGGIYNQGRMLVQGTTVSQNTSAADGGGIYNNGGTITISRSHIRTNRSDGGGAGIASSGSLWLVDSIVANNIDGGGIHNEGGELTITQSTISANSTTGFGGGIRNSGTLAIDHSTISDNTAPNGAGGGLYNEGSAALHTTIVRDNIAPVGAGLWSNSALAVSISTVSTNISTARGGGIHNASSGTLNVNQTTISANRTTQGSGGGLFNQGTTNIRNTTISGNTATGGNGGGIVNSTGSITFTNSTVSANSSDLDGGGIFEEDGSAVRIQNTIIAANSAPVQYAPDCALGAGLTSLGNNLIGAIDSRCPGVVAGVNGDKGGSPAAPLDPKLGPLQNNGVRTLTHALLAGSPAIDAGGPVGCLPTDQRGIRRPRDGDGDGVAVCDIGAFELTFGWYVNAQTGNDANDCLTEITPCFTISGAVDKASPGDTVTVAAGIYNESVSIRKNLRLIGAGVGATIINDDRVRDNSVVAIRAGISALISGVTIQNGFATPGGGIVNNGILSLLNSEVRDNLGGIGAGIFNNGQLNITDSVIRDNSTDSRGGGIANRGTLRLLRTTVSGNSVGSGGGGGIWNDGGTVTLQSSTLSGNSAGSGGALLNDSGTVTIINSTISGNSVSNANGGSGFGGGIRSSGTISLQSSTITANTATNGRGGISADAGTVTLVNTILSNNSGPQQPDCFGTLTSQGHNLVGDITGCTFTPATGDQVGVVAQLAPLADNGGPTLTHLPLSGSPAIDAGDQGACPAADQRGIARPRDGDRNGSRVCDIGAVEVDTFFWYVAKATGNDANDCLSWSSACQTIGAALGKARSGDTLLVASGLYPEQLAITKDLWLIGETAAPPVITGSSAGRVVSVTAGVTVTISGVVVENGSADGNGGGGIRNDGTLELKGSSIRNNRSAGPGGGIFNVGTLTLVNSTVSGNSANGPGGGIASGNANSQLTVVGSTISGNRSVNGDALGKGGGISTTSVTTITNSTVSGNSAVGGGGIWVGASPVTITSSTITDNSASEQVGGIYGGAGTISVTNSIVARNQGALSPDCFGITSLGHNLIGVAKDCVSTSAPGDLVDVPVDKLLLGPLAVNGGPTLTHALLDGSPAIDAGAACPPNDQRGFGRTVGAACDIGAFEWGATLDSGLNIFEDTWGFENRAGEPREEQFFDDFGALATTHTITRTEVLSSIQGIDLLNLPITFRETDIQAVLPLTLTTGLPEGAEVRYVPRPIAYLYEKVIVEATYDDQFTDYYSGTLRSGLCAGMTAGVADLYAGDTPISRFDPVVATVRDIPDAKPALDFIHRYHGRQVGSQILNHLANAGRYDVASYYRYLTTKMSSSEWGENPEILGIMKGSNCADIEVGHALLPYRIAPLPDNKVQIFVYDPNYVLKEGDPERFVILDLATNSWSYNLGNDGSGREVIWQGQLLYSTPLRLFQEKPLLPTATGTDVLAANGGASRAWGGRRGAWGGFRSAWGGRRGAWGGEELRTGCVDGEGAFVRQLDGTLRVTSITGLVPEVLFFPAGSQWTFSGQGAPAGITTGDMLFFGPNSVSGFVSTINSTTGVSATVSADFHTLQLRTTNAAPGSITAYQMHEDPAGEFTRVYAVSNTTLGGSEELAIIVSEDLGHVTVVNNSDTPKSFELGLAAIGAEAITQSTTEQTVGPRQQITFTPTDWNDLEAPIERTQHQAGLQALYTFAEGSGATVHDSARVDQPLDLTVADPTAAHWTAGGLEITRPTTLASLLPATRIISDETNALTLEAWVRPAAGTQNPLARIVSIAADQSRRNIELLQERGDGDEPLRYSVRLRTSATKSSALPPLRTPQLARPDGMHHIVYTRDAAGRVRLYVDGLLQAQRTLRGDFSTWDTTYRLALANTPSGNRPWLGTFGRVALYNRALGADEVGQLFSAGPGGGR